MTQRSYKIISDICTGGTCLLDLTDDLLCRIIVRLQDAKPLRAACRRCRRLENACVFSLKVPQRFLSRISNRRRASEAPFLLIVIILQPTEARRYAITGL